MTYFKTTLLEDIQWIQEESAPLYEIDHIWTRPWNNCNGQSTIEVRHPALGKAQTMVKQLSGVDSYINQMIQLAIPEDGIRAQHVTCWWNRYKGDEFQEPHDHILEPQNPASPSSWKSFASFVLFLKIPDNSHCFYFVGPRGGKNLVKEKTGDFIMFNSNDVHGVDPHNADTERWTIAGNVLVSSQVDTSNLTNVLVSMNG